MHSFWRVAVLYEWSGENRQKHGELKVRYPERPEPHIINHARPPHTMLNRRSLDRSLLDVT